MSAIITRNVWIVNCTYVHYVLYENVYERRIGTVTTCCSCRYFIQWRRQHETESWLFFSLHSFAGRKCSGFTLLVFFTSIHRTYPWYSIPILLLLFVVIIIKIGFVQQFWWESYFECGKCCGVIFSYLVGGWGKVRHSHLPHSSTYGALFWYSQDQFSAQITLEIYPAQ